MLGTEGSVHKWKENLFHVDRDFRQLEKQSKSDCPRCHSSDSSLQHLRWFWHLYISLYSARTPCNHPVIPAWVENSVKCRTGRERRNRLAGWVRYGLYHPHISALFHTRSRMGALQGWHPQPACSSTDTACSGQVGQHCHNHPVLVWR